MSQPHDAGARTTEDRVRSWGRRLDPREHLGRPASFRVRVERLRDRLFLIVQMAIGASLAWTIAHRGLGHPQAFFAPVTVIVSLGLTYGQRLRRIVELTVGVAVGVLMGDLFVHLFGTGSIQIVLVLLFAMTIAVLLNGGALVMIQAGVQSMIVLTLVAPPGYAFSRWLDAVVGGCVALVLATITPVSPIRRPRREAAAVLAELGTVLDEASRAVREGDLERADDALERARDSEALLSSLREATTEGLAVTRQSPFRRHHGADVGAIATLTESLDRAVRNTRVLVRRCDVAVHTGERVPEPYLDAVERLAGAFTEMSHELHEHRRPTVARDEIVEVARLAGPPAQPTSLSGEVVRAQIRSICVDLLMVTGLDYDESRERIPARPDELDD